MNRLKRLEEIGPVAGVRGFNSGNGATAASERTR